MKLLFAISYHHAKKYKEIKTLLNILWLYFVDKNIRGQSINDAPTHRLGVNYFFNNSTLALVMKCLTRGRYWKICVKC